MKDTSKLAQYLKDSRLKAGLSQSDVAQALRYSSPQFISNWERGVSSPPLDTLSKLIELYKLPRNEVIDLILEETRSRLEKDIRADESLKKRA
jgi:transcriptional regulator with XRE-family HTH domain